MVIIKKNFYALGIGVIFFSLMSVYIFFHDSSFSKIYSRIPDSVLKYYIVNGKTIEEVSESDKEYIDSFLSEIFQSKKKGIRRGTGVDSVPGITIQVCFADGTSLDAYFSILTEINGMNVIITGNKKGDSFQVILSPEQFKKYYLNMEMLKQKYVTNP